MQGELAGGDWLERRYHPDLEPLAERALRAAGLAWHDEPEAERQLRIAEQLAPQHRAVVVAHYRYFLYKHRFAEALPYLERCLAMFAQVLGWPDPARPLIEVAECELGDAPDLRAWMFARQAYGYLLLRLGRTQEGIAVLEALVALDVRDQIKTRVLLDVITRPAES